MQSDKATAQGGRCDRGGGVRTRENGMSDAAAQAEASRVCKQFCCLPSKYARSTLNKAWHTHTGTHTRAGLL